MVPDWLQWSDVFLSLIAFGLAVVTLPTAFQMWWGKPHLTITFRREGVEAGAVLFLSVSNKPVKNKLLRSIGVRRDAAQNVGAIAEIRESGTNRFIGRKTLELSVNRGERSFRVNIFPKSPALAFLIRHKHGEENAEFSDGKIELPQGEYMCELNIIWREEKIVQRRTFAVGGSINNTRWRAQ
ncbi:MAG: hypothetical protein F4Z47_01705 [Rhodospirillaceae bacterium]|nr:hypothetical protein [Rhodospirillaceae bacterium]